MKDDDGRAKLYADIAHPINSACREMIQQRVIEAFEEEKARAKLPGYVPSYDDFDQEDAPAWAPPAAPRAFGRRVDADPGGGEAARPAQSSRRPTPAAGPKGHTTASARHLRIASTRRLPASLSRWERGSRRGNRDCVLAAGHPNPLLVREETAPSAICKTLDGTAPSARPQPPEPLRRRLRPGHDQLGRLLRRYGRGAWRVRTFAVPQLVAAGAGRGPRNAAFVPLSAGRRASCRPRPCGCPGSAGAAGSRQIARRRRRTSSASSPATTGRWCPGRLINSAKSWLCHSGVDRTAGLLPWHGAADVERLSPVEVSARYLAHVRDAWDARFPRHPLAEQDFVLTLPASFDEVARELTVKAAALAGLPRVVLIEEPQAAFYAWIYAHSDDWDQLVQPGQKILVCDIGGGTSDFTLIRVRRGEGGQGAVPPRGRRRPPDPRRRQPRPGPGPSPGTAADG